MKKSILIVFVNLFLVYPVLAGDEVRPISQEKTSESLETGIFLIRHAERDAGEDPPLNDKGKKRAKVLADVFADSGITAIFCTDYIRNRQTALPLAKRLGLDIQVLPDSLTQDTDVLTKYFIQHILPEHHGGVILFIGNQKSDIKTQFGNLQALYRGLGGKRIPLTRYFDVHHIIRKGDETVRIIHSTYGDTGNLKKNH